MNLSNRLLQSAALGVAVALLALVLTFVVPTDGVRINTSAWPPAAKAILVERPNEPLSDEQWHRIEKALRSHGGEAMPSHTVAAELRQAWPLATLVALLAVALAWWRLKSLTLGTAVLVLGPTLLMMTGAFTHAHPYLK